MKGLVLGKSIQKVKERGPVGPNTPSCIRILGEYVIAWSPVPGGYPGTCGYQAALGSGSMGSERQHLHPTRPGSLTRNRIGLAKVTHRGQRDWLGRGLNCMTESEAVAR